MIACWSAGLYSYTSEQGRWLLSRSYLYEPGIRLTVAGFLQHIEGQCSLACQCFGVLVFWLYVERLNKSVVDFGRNKACLLRLVTLKPELRPNWLAPMHPRAQWMMSSLHFSAVRDGCTRGGMDAFNSLLSFLPQSRDAPVRTCGISDWRKRSRMGADLLGNTYTTDFFACCSCICTSAVCCLLPCWCLMSAQGCAMLLCLQACGLLCFQGWGLGVQVICRCTGTHCWDSFVCVRCAASPTASDAIGRPRLAPRITLRDSGRSPCDRRA